jgi:hypothetical protein
MIELKILPWQDNPVIEKMTGFYFQYPAVAGLSCL